MIVFVLCLILAGIVVALYFKTVAVLEQLSKEDDEE